MTAVSTRLVRLLNMVPYFQANPKITYAEAATDLGVSVKQLRDDVLARLRAQAGQADEVTA